MPKTPDFQTIAEQLVPVECVALVVDALRLMWNARGAADSVQIAAAFAHPHPAVKTLDQAIRSLDR